MDRRIDDKPHRTRAHAGCRPWRLLFAVLAALLTAPGSARAIVDEIPVMDRVERSLSRTLLKLDRDLAAGAEKLGRLDMRSPLALRTLRALQAQIPHAANVGLVDARGKIIAVEPPAFRGIAGGDVEGEETFLLARRDRRPVMGKVFRAREGFDAVAVHYPVFLAGRQRFKGSIRVAIRPREFLAGIIDEVVRRHMLRIWVIQTDGYILYDPYEELVGLNLFADEFFAPFPELISAGRRMAAESMGSANFEFVYHDLKTRYRHDAFWSTLELYGTSWRIIFNRPSPEKKAP